METSHGRDLDAGRQGRALDGQRAWLVWHDKSCQVYDSREFGREGQVLSGPVCRAAEIDQRIDQLISYAEGEHG